MLIGETDEMPAIPNVNINGTNGQTLLKEYCDAMYATEAALAKLADATCHGRDFWAGNPENTFQQAREERGEALTKLRDVIAYLEGVAVGIDRQLRDKPGYKPVYQEG